MWLRKQVIIGLAFIFISLSYAQKKDSTSVLPDSLLYYDNESQLFYNKNDYKNTFELSEKGLKIARVLNDHFHLSSFYNRIGKTYNRMHDYEKAKSYYKKSIAHDLLIKNDKRLTWAAYNNMGGVYYTLQNTDSALIYYKKYQEICTKNNDTLGIKLALINLASTHAYSDKENYDEAYLYLKKFEKVTESVIIDNPKGLRKKIKNISHIIWGDYYKHKNKFELAKTNYKKSLNIATSTNDFYDICFVYERYASLEKEQGHYKEAYNYLNLSSTYKDSIFDPSLIREGIIADAKFQATEHEIELSQSKKTQKAILKKSRQIMYTLTALGIILTLLLINVYGSYKFRTKVAAKLKEQNIQLQKAKKNAENFALLKSQFTSTLSHELRTPLYGVVGLTSLLLEEKNLNKREKQYLKSLKFSGDYLLNLVNDVLHLSKIEANSVTIQNSSFDLKNLAKNIINSFKFQAEQEKNQLTMSYDDDIPERLMGDSVKLSQILINLVGNAIKFTHNGVVNLAIAMRKTINNKVYLSFTVQDNGLGISEKNQEKIFETFSQLNDDKGQYKGSGLGLNIVKELITLFDSTIELESVENKGTTFKFELNFEIDKNPKSHINGQKADTFPYENKRVLIVEDNKISQIVTLNILKKEKFKCTLVDNGLAAVEMMKTKIFDLTLMDLNMHIMDGIEATKQIRLFDKRTPIIALTAMLVNEIEHEIYEAGINDIISKPYDKHEIFRVISKNINMT